MDQYFLIWIFHNDPMSQIGLWRIVINVCEEIHVAIIVFLYLLSKAVFGIYQEELNICMSPFLTSCIILKAHSIKPTI